MQSTAQILDTLMRQNGGVLPTSQAFKAYLKTQKVPVSSKEIKTLFRQKRQAQKQEEAETTAREERAQQPALSFLEFGCKYFPHYCELPSSPLHRELATQFEAMVTRHSPQRVALAAPRGHAKTTWVSVLGPLWCICYPQAAQKKFILLLSDTAGQAEANLEAIREELEENELLKADFGDLVGDPLKDHRRWTQARITTANGIQVAAYGSGKSLRGVRKGAHRPDLLLADDLENDENTMTPAQRKKLESWWLKAATKIGGPKGLDLFVIGTILHYDSLLSHLLANPGYYTQKFKALLKRPTRTDLWQTWERIYCDTGFSEPHRKANSRAFYEANRAAMDEGAEVLWPEGDSLYNLIETLTLDGPAAFDSEKQNEPVNPDDCLFQEEWFRWYCRDGEVGEPSDLRLPAISYTVGAVDPSMGKHAHRGDYSTILVLGRGVDGRDYVLEADLARRSPDTIITDTIAAHKRWNCREWAVEATAFQEFMCSEMEKRGRAEGVHLPLLPVHPNTDKVMRISSLQPTIRNGQLVFHRSQHLLYDQLRLFPLADHDDGPDALHMAYERGQGQVAPAFAPTGVRTEAGNVAPYSRLSDRGRGRRGGPFESRGGFAR